MGTQEIQLKHDAETLRRFTYHIIQDVRAFEYMLEEGRFETGIHRIGAEQELFLIDKRCQPAGLAEEVLQHNTEPKLVTELTRFNLELNLDPYEFTGTCFSDLHKQIDTLLAYTRGIVQKEGADIVMTGILPTIHLSDLTLDNMAPMPRYFALNDAIMKLRGGPAQYQIRGMDELFFWHDNILVEGCNTSFQTHFQVSPDEFVHYYNIAQLVAGPCVALGANSPVLFGKRLWHETRIALFQQAVDTRSSNLYLRDMSPRVHFGTEWVHDSILEIYREDIARFRVIMTTESEDPFEELRAGKTPKLKALQLHNGTVYRWNRACYGISGNGKPHLRIENRVLPSGPTVIDEVANAAFWFGLVHGMAHTYDDIPSLMDFDEAKSNFVACARNGLGTQIRWLEGRHVPAHQLIAEELLPIAKSGLQRAGVDEADIEKYLGVIEGRVTSRQNGAQWMLDSITSMKKQPSNRAERLDALVLWTKENQLIGEPVHTWPLAKLIDKPGSRQMLGTRVEHYMTTEIFTVHEEELIEFVASLMDWRRIRHVIVEDNKHRLVGIVTHRNLLRYMAERDKSSDMYTPVREIMVKDPLFVTPETSTRQAIQIMRNNKVSALPVLQDERLVGIITERDFLSIAGKLLDESLEAIDNDESTRNPSGEK